jgi:hypothetical protein
LASIFSALIYVTSPGEVKSVVLGKRIAQFLSSITSWTVGMMLRGLRGVRPLGVISRPGRTVLPRMSHMNILTARGSELRLLAHQQQLKTQLLSRAVRHDRVLTASLGLVSGGIAVTSVLQHEDCRDFKGLVQNLYGGADDLLHRGSGQQFDEPVREVCR